MSKAKFQVVLKVVRGEATVVESERSVLPVWNLESPRGNPMLMTDEELKAHVAAPLIEALAANVKDMAVELLMKLDRETRIVYSDDSETE